MYLLILFSLHKSPLMHWGRCFIREGRFVKHDLPPWLILLMFLTFMCLEMDSTDKMQEPAMTCYSQNGRGGNVGCVFCLSLLTRLPSHHTSTMPYQHLTGDFSSLHSLTGDSAQQWKKWQKIPVKKAESLDYPGEIRKFRTTYCHIEDMVKDMQGYALYALVWFLLTVLENEKTFYRTLEELYFCHTLIQYIATPVTSIYSRSSLCEQEVKQW